MADENISEWLMRGSAVATIIYNDPVWSEQEYAMQRGERTRGDFDPPVPGHYADLMRADWDRASALHDHIAAEGCDALPEEADPQAWAAVDGDMLIAGRYAGCRGIRCVPAMFMDEYRALVATPLPGSADLETA